MSVSALYALLTHYSPSEHYKHAGQTSPVVLSDEVKAYARTYYPDVYPVD